MDHSLLKSSSSSSKPIPEESSREFWNRPDKGTFSKVEYSDIDTTNDMSKGSLLYNEDNNESPTTTTTVNQRRQTKVLLVSLIESLCKTYGGSPETTRKMFYNICQTLRSLGFIDSEFHDEVASIRFTYHKAFEHIFYAAAQNVREQELHQPKLLTSAEQEEYIKQHIESFNNNNNDHYQHESELMPLKYSLNNIQNSRYQNDFIEVGMLGRGGFASAWKVRNKLDDVQYAIKKIRLFDEKEQDASHEKILREIKNLARLEHHNVVRYYSSWLEYANEIEREEQDEDEEEEELSWLSSNSDKENDDESSIFNGQDPTFEESGKSTTIEEMSFISFGNGDSESSCSSNSNLYLHPSSSTSTIRKSKEETTNGGFILYIQMQLCPSTLHEYLKYRNQNTDIYFDEQQNINLFVQILEGCAYIHQEGLIHRDLKPSNIFLSRPANNVLDYRSRHYCYKHDGQCNNSNSTELLVPKIGDFGLAASVMNAVNNNEEEKEENALYSEPNFDSQQSSSHSSSVIELFTTAASLSSTSSFPNKSSSFESDMQLLTTRRKSEGRPKLRRNITSGVGTRTYAAPEQLAIPSIPYDEKADIYSLGIILFELYQPFSTAMERADTIENLKKGDFPHSFIKSYPNHTQVIQSMMHPDPYLRPTAIELLDHQLFRPYHIVEATDNETTTTAEQLNLLHDREMTEMRHQYDEMKHQNEDLQRRLNELQSKLDDCQVNPKRHHTKEDEEECNILHEPKKKELNVTSSIISKIMFSSSPK